MRLLDTRSVRISSTSSVRYQVIYGLAFSGAFSHLNFTAHPTRTLSPEPFRKLSPELPYMVATIRAAFLWGRLNFLKGKSAMKAITLFNTPIRVDESGMICLTDMWKASGKSEIPESPYHYLRNKQTKEFLAELEKNHESLSFTERGVHGETYGGKFVAYDYAAWLNPEFKYAAYKSSMTTSPESFSISSLSAQLNMKCHEFDQEDMASFCGQGLAAWRYTKPVLMAEFRTWLPSCSSQYPGCIHKRSNQYAYHTARVRMNSVSSCKTADRSTICGSVPISNLRKALLSS